MMKAYWKDILRSIINGKKRFISIALIATLGVTMMCGLRAACVDLRYSADRFFDEQNLFDVRVLSTLGLTKEDMEALEAVEGVQAVDGGYNETVYTQIDEMRKSIEIRTLSKKKFNAPYILEGKLPEKENEIVITENYKNHTGKGVGDEIVLEEKGEYLKSTFYKISGIMIDAMDINSSEGSMGFRSTASTDYVGYVVPEAAENDIYTVIYLDLDGVEKLNCYTDEYEQRVEKLVATIESNIKEKREKDRYQEVYDEAMEEWLDGEREMKDEFAKADAEIADAKNELEDGWKKLADGKKELADARKEMNDGKKQIKDGLKELESKEKQAKSEFAKGRQEIEKGFEEIASGKEELKASYVQLAAGQEELDGAKAQLTAQQEEVKAQYGDEVANQQFAAAWETLDAKQAELDAGMAQYEAGAAELTKAEQELIAGEKKLDEQEVKVYAQIETGRKELEKAQKELEKGEKELAKGEQELVDAEQELKDGEKELEENLLEYEEEKAKAEKELADAKKEIDDIDMTKWYVQDRFALSGCANLKSDADSIQAIGDIFPVLFLTVAILISLTTITRMVEEERGLIGTYKALGFTDREIRRKYMIYAAAACLIGGLIGDIGGYVILPAIIFIVFHVMYILPEYAFQFDLLYGMGGILLFEAGVLIATILSSSKALKNTPATLMRPKAPKAGSRVFLERIPFLWKRLSFLNKVTARNLFRYKKRLMMTVFGIAGCTALLLCGFTIKNTVSEMMPQQYQKVYRYDMMAVSSEEDFDTLKENMDEDEEIGDYISVRIESVEVINEEDKKEAVQLIIVPEGEMIESYIFLKNKENEEYQLKDGDIFLTKNATKILGFEEGEKITWQNQNLVEVEAPITRIVENYLGNMAYMTKATYEELFGEYKYNGVLVHFSEKCEDEAVYTDRLAREEGMLSALSTQAMEDEFEPAFALINMVVYVVLVLAALLAFVVLFTLSNTNISERERELATIKVLGFYDSEVHAYVNKETMILTFLGILCGMPMGWALGSYLMGILEFPSLEFYIILYPESYVIAGAITLVFALMVNFITNKTLNKINMIEALKSVE